MSYLVVPVFAPANAGVAFGGSLMDELSDPLTLAVAAGLVAGPKPAKG